MHSPIQNSSKLAVMEMCDWLQGCLKMWVRFKSVSTILGAQCAMIDGSKKKLLWCVINMGSAPQVCNRNTIAILSLYHLCSNHHNMIPMYNQCISYTSVYAHIYIMMHTKQHRHSETHMQMCIHTCTIQGHTHILLIL